MEDIRQQVRVTSCGVYATSVALANNTYPGKFIQQSMRAHLVECFNNYLHVSQLPC